LEGTAKWLAAVSPAPMTAAVVNGLGAEGILQRVRDNKADLVVMTTHGRGRWAVSSSAAWPMS
jgi:nucleotide-binding universal stress UspA family protein